MVASRRYRPAGRPSLGGRAGLARRHLLFRALPPAPLDATDALEATGGVAVGGSGAGMSLEASTDAGAEGDARLAQAAQKLSAVAARAVYPGGSEVSWRLAGSKSDERDAVTPGCLGGCSQHGVCSNGRCHCNPGWAGDNCGTADVRGRMRPARRLRVRALLL